MSGCRPTGDVLGGENNEIQSRRVFSGRVVICWSNYSCNMRLEKNRRDIGWYINNTRRYDNVAAILALAMREGLFFIRKTAYLGD